MLPKCDKDEGCDWQCEVTKPGATDKNDKEVRAIATVGEFARDCVVPSMEAP